MDKSVERAFKSLEILESIKLSIVVPTYNTPHLKKNIQEIISVLPKVSYEIIVVNDGSKIFPENLEEFRNVKVFHHLINQGKGQALRTGASVAKGKIIFFFDADLDIPPELIKPYYEIMISKSSPDILIGSKRHINAQVFYPFSRRVMSYTYQRMIKFLFGLEILDSQVGIKAFKKAVIKDLLPNLQEQRFALDIELLVCAFKKGYFILEAPVKIRQKFGSTINLGAVLRMIFDTLKIWFRLKGGSDNG